jgi:predicted outer membrane repeat protein
VIKNTTFENLHAGDRGGAIWIGDSKLYIYNCKFSNNSCGNYGGAIYSDTSELYVYDTEFKGNYADWDGGAVYLTAGDLENGSVPSIFYRSTFDGNRAGWDGGAIYCDGGLSIMTSATTYGCDFKNNSAGENGGAVCTALDCRFGFFSDKDTGKPGTMKNNSAGELGGGFYQGKNAPTHFGGEIYASGNVSSAGNDDLRIRYGFACKILESITSPEGSIGIYYEDADGGQLGEWTDESITVNSAAFFFNNGEFECKFDQGYVKTMGYDGMMYTMDLVKPTALTGSIFGEGSFATIVSLLALLTSIAAIGMNVASNKKKTASIRENEAEEYEKE